MFRMYLCTKFQVSSLNYFLIFPIKLEATEKIHMATCCYFTLLKYIHNTHIFFKDLLQYTTQDPTLNDASHINPTSQILTYATLLLILVGNQRIGCNGHQLYKVHTMCLESSPMVQDLKVGGEHRPYSDLVSFPPCMIEESTLIKNKKRIAPSAVTHRFNQ